MGVALTAVTDISSKNALIDFFSTETGGSFSLDAKERTLEVCWDLCEFYAMKAGASAEAWDAVLLHQYYYVAPGFREEFRDRYASLAKSIVTKYDHLCPGRLPERKPSCILSQLGKRTQLEVASVRYDEGYRCQVWGRLTDSKFEGKSSCTRIKHAS
jgi:hypothetical protein